MDYDIPLFEIPWDIDDLKNIIDSVGRGSYWAKGPYVTEFEERLAEYFEAKHAIVVNSGTSALLAALNAVGVGTGDEVIVPSFTQQATVNAVEFLGATPVFADIERDTYGLSPAAVEASVTADTAAVLPVHVYGSICNIQDIHSIADKNELYLIEDAAEAQGALRNGRMAGTFGHVGAISFCQNKILPTGEGGAVVTDDDDIAAGCKRFRSHGREPTNYFSSPTSGIHVDVGLNFRMPDIVAALGCSQMEKIEGNIAGRRRAAEAMNTAFHSMENIEPHTGLDGDRHVYQFYTVTLSSDVDREAVIEYLADRGVSSKVYWDPSVHRSVYYSEQYEIPNLPVTEDVSSRVLSLPIHPELTPGEVEHIVDTVEEALQEV